MLPRAGRPHDQLLRPTLVAGIGGLIIGHILWLIGITAAMSAPKVSCWVLILSAVIVVLAVGIGYLARRLYQRKKMVWSAFLACLPISPVIFTLIELGVTYL